jgi:hypothetical protein
VSVEKPFQTITAFPFSADIGLTRKEIHEARQIRDAELGLTFFMARMFRSNSGFQTMLRRSRVF